MLLLVCIANICVVDESVACHICCNTLITLCQFAGEAAAKCASAEACGYTSVLYIIDMTNATTTCNKNNDNNKEYLFISTAGMENFQMQLDLTYATCKQASGKTQQQQQQQQHQPTMTK